MIDQSKVGTDWQADELDAIVATYFTMLAAELAGRPYVKAHHARDLMARTGRSHRSVEFKHMNLSSVLADLGLPTIRGYRRMDNIQNALFPAVERYLDAPAHTASGALEDAQLIRAEVERCRGLLHELTQQGGVVSGEPPVALTTHALWRAVHARAERRPGLTLAPWAGPDVALTAPRAALIQALVNLVDNAHDAELRTGHPQAITTGTSHEGHDIRLWVRDQGPGFPAEILSELGEAFVTSRPGEGLGLGLHLAESLARALGGRLDVRSSTQGSEVTLILPETSPHE